MSLKPTPAEKDKLSPHSPAPQNSQFIATTPHDELHVGKLLLALLEHLGVTKVEEVKDAVGVEADLQSRTVVSRERSLV